MIIGINAVIVNETSDAHFDVYGKCPHCGWVERCGSRNNWCGRGSRTPLGTKTCSKCGTKYKMEADNTK